MKKTTNLRQVCPKIAIRNFCNLVLDVPDKKDCNKIYGIFGKVIFLKIPMVFVIFEFEICALMRFFNTFVH